MQLDRTLKHLIVAALFAFGFGGGAVAIVQAGGTSQAMTQIVSQDATPPGTPCVDDAEGVSGTPEADSEDASGTPESANDADSGDKEDADTSDKNEEENGNQDESDLESDNGSPESATDADSGDKEDADNGTPEATDQGNDDGCEMTGAPGELIEGQDLQSQATISIDDAIATAQGAAQGDLGTVTLDNETGTLVYEVEIGDQDVVIDATTGKVVDITSSGDKGDD